LFKNHTYIDDYAFREGESILVAGNGDLNVKRYCNGEKFNASTLPVIQPQETLNGKISLLFLENILKIERTVYWWSN
jgi:hypothetical protein